MTSVGDMAPPDMCAVTQRHVCESIEQLELMLEFPLSSTASDWCDQISCFEAPTSRAQAAINWTKGTQVWDTQMTMMQAMQECKS